MKRWREIGFATALTLAIGLVSAYGAAQPKPGAPAKPAPAPAAGGHEHHHGHECVCDKGSCTADCDCGACAKGSAACGDAGTCGNHGKHSDMHCPMTQLASLADVKVEKTKTGATLLLTAKDPSKAAEVQAMADKLAEHMKAGGCPMEKSGHGMMMQGHQHGAAGSSPAKPAPAPTPAAAKK